MLIPLNSKSATSSGDLVGDDVTKPLAELSAAGSGVASGSGLDVSSLLLAPSSCLTSLVTSSASRVT